MSEIAFYVLFIMVPLVILWLILLSDLVTRPDLTIWRNLVWGALTLLFAEIAALAYLISRPFPYPENSARLNEDESGSTREFLAVAHKRAQGLVGDEEWEAFKSELLT